MTCLIVVVVLVVCFLAIKAINSPKSGGVAPPSARPGSGKGGPAQPGGNFGGSSKKGIVTAVRTVDVEEIVLNDFVLQAATFRLKIL